MLQVQEFLRNHNGDFSKLTDELGIEVKYHPRYPLVKLNYSQIDSPKMNPIVIECRGLILHKDTFEVVAGCFPRFFNMGEALEINDRFDWSCISANEKVDGSFIQLYWFDSRWNVATRGSFADQVIQPGFPTWEFVVLSLITPEQLEGMNTGWTYIFELCSLWNKVVREYRTPVLYLLGIIDNGCGADYSDTVVHEVAHEYGFTCPETYVYSLTVNPKDLLAFIRRQEEKDSTWEGVVVRDSNGLRMKIKSSTYVALHQLKGNGNLFLTKNLLPFVLTGETDEVIAYFPECADSVKRLEAEVKKQLDALLDIWEGAKHIDDRKLFAQAIVGKTPYSGILFAAWINGTDDIATVFRTSPELILKCLKQNKYDMGE
jgi:hypothetical protein